ncbi:hypothetical protein K3495_g11637 [Podosphaera aphanis]|nr:hypothetical protein K3495_g11637 [Podosphaera aphanis]
MIIWIFPGSAISLDHLATIQPKKLRKDPPEAKKKASAWPEWDGSKELYSTDILQLAAKIDADWDLLGGNKAACMNMMNRILKDLRGRVSQWFSTGGPNRDWDYELYIEQFNKNFEDKTSVHAASSQLSMMRRGQHQTFSSYLNDFEYTLARANGISWEDRIKIHDLYLGLNERSTNLLIPVLIPVTLSDTNYTLFVK